MKWGMLSCCSQFDNNSGYWVTLYCVVSSLLRLWTSIATFICPMLSIFLVSVPVIRTYVPVIDLVCEKTATLWFCWLVQTHVSFLLYCRNYNILPLPYIIYCATSWLLSCLYRWIAWIASISCFENENCTVMLIWAFEFFMQFNLYLIKSVLIYLWVFWKVAPKSELIML